MPGRRAKGRSRGPKGDSQEPDRPGSSFLVVVNPHLRVFYPLVFRERKVVGGETETERERIEVRDRLIASCTCPDWG